MKARFELLLRQLFAPQEQQFNLFFGFALLLHFFDKITIVNAALPHLLVKERQLIRPEHSADGSVCIRLNSPTFLYPQAEIRLLQGCYFFYVVEAALLNATHFCRLRLIKLIVLAELSCFRINTLGLRLSGEQLY